MFPAPGGGEGESRSIDHGLQQLNIMFTVQSRARGPFVAAYLSGYVKRVLQTEALAGEGSGFLGSG